MAKIAYFVHGRGSGHASRARTVVTHLRRHGHDVDICAGGDALRLLGAEPTLRKVTPIAAGWHGLSVGLGRVRADLRYLAATRAELVVTDGDAPGLHAARLARLPCVAIGHGLLFNNAEVGALPLVPRIYERFNAASSCWLAQRKIAVHFLHGLSNDRRTVVARPDLTHLVGPALTGVRPYVVAYFRDQNGDDVIAHALAQGFEVRHFGDAPKASSGAIVHGFCRDAFLRALRGCSGILTSAGSNILAEGIALNKPIFACYRRDDHEQRMNALLLDRASLGDAFCFADDVAQGMGRFAQGLRDRRFESYAIQNKLPCVNECVAQACAELVGRVPALSPVGAQVA